jgi:hypothetical protein
MIEWLFSGKINMSVFNSTCQFLTPEILKIVCFWGYKLTLMAREAFTGHLLATNPSTAQTGYK